MDPLNFLNKLGVYMHLEALSHTITDDMARKV
jgi:hypothetical protein